MSDLGFRQVIVNDSADVVSVSTGGDNYIEIKGYGQFKVGASTMNEEKAPEDPEKGSTPITGAPSGWAIDQVWEVRVFLSAATGATGMGSIRGSGQVEYFQVAKITGSSSTSFGDLLKESVNTFKEIPVPIGGNPNTILTFDGTTFTFENGYEGYTVDKILATKIYDPAIPGFDDRAAIPVDITGAVTEGKGGVGYASQVEEDVRLNTPYTRSQYDIHVGGNDIIDFIDKKARYTEIAFITKEDHYKGKLPHEMLGYGDANTESLYAGRKYVVFIKAKDSSGDINTAAIALIKTI